MQQNSARMQRPPAGSRPFSRPPSAPPNAGTKRKERDYEQDSSDETNINVVVRCRGRNERELRENSGVVVATGGVKGKSVELSMGPNAISNKTYHFDKVFSPAADQAIIFDDVVAPILGDMLTGYNCTIFAYGQTGTGKTYTMSGDMTDTCGLLSDAAGIIPRVLYSLFQKLEADEIECAVKCSFIELYNEELRDLLSPDDNVKLKIYDDTNRKNHISTVVQGMEESHIQSAASGIKLLQAGSYRRQVAATKCNDLSSRSHTVFTVTTYVKKSGDSTDDYVCSGKLNLVDLAGSENIQRSGAENKRAAEAGLINKSLLTLGRVINALVDKSAHIPYRESKLTRLLQDSLGGRTKTCIIATVSPAKSNLEETISTLDYAFRAKNIRNKPQVNSMIKKTTLLKDLTAEIEKIKGELIATRQRNGVYLSNDQYEEITVESESRRILSEEQKARIETMEVSLRNKVQELFSLTNNFTTLKKDYEATRILLDSTKDILGKTQLVLDQTKQNLEEETILRQKYAATEDTLHSLGGSLISTVSTSVKDLNNLHAKLHRRSDLHAKNKTAWNAIISTATTTLQSVDARLESLEQQHNAMLSSTRDRIEGLIAQEMKRAADGKTSINETSSTLAHQIQQIQDQSASAKDNVNEFLEEIKDLREDVKEKVGGGLHGLSEAAARISGEVIFELDQFHAQLHTSYSGLGKDFKTLFEDLTKQLSSQREETLRLRQALREAHQRQLQSSLLTTSQLQASMEAERRASEADREQLLKHVSALISNMSKGRDERMAETINTTQTRIIEATTDLETASKSYDHGIDRWLSQDSELFEKVTQSKEDLKGRMKKDWSAVNARNTAIQSSTKAIHQETVKIVDAQLDAMSTQMEALDDFVTRARQCNNTHHEKHVEDLGDLSVEVRTRLTSLESRFDGSTLAALSGETEYHLDELSSKVQERVANVHEPLQQLGQQLGESTIAEYTATGETPQKREWSYPTSLPHTLRTESTTPEKQKLIPATDRARTESPRKRMSPRKSPRKQPIHIDTPPLKTRPTQAILPPVPTFDKKSQHAHPTTTNNNGGLKDLDINITATPASTVNNATDHKDNVLKTTTTTSRVPTKTGSGGRGARKIEVLELKDLHLEKLEKEHVPASTTILLDGAGEKFNAARSLYMPSTTTAAAAATTITSTASRKTDVGGMGGIGVGGRILRSSTTRRNPPDFGRSMSE